MLVGRDREQARLADLLERARQGSAGSVVVRGDPGVGKSALLAWLTSTAADAVLLRTQGYETEAPLPYAALHRLLRPVMRLRDGLSGPQSRALRVAFGEEDGTAVEPFLVAVATLSMLTAAAEEQLLLCVVDDAHWLDSATADALVFCARRIEADRVLLVFAARDGADPEFAPDGVPQLLVAGLNPEAARALFDEHVGPAAAGVAERLVAETGGNPLALLELPAELTTGQLQGTAPLPAQLHLTARVEQVFLERSRRLPTAVQMVLLVVAADDTGRVDVISTAAGRLGLGQQALDAALGSDLVTTDVEQVRLRHPLVRSAVYQAGSLEARRRVHDALAGALAALGDRDRATWHRAAATAGPDPALSDALEDVGARAERRGGYAAALAAYDRAAQLTDDVPRLARLTLAAARSAWACGQVDRSRELVLAARTAASAMADRDEGGDEGADEGAGPADVLVLSGDIARLRGRIEVNLGSAVEAHRIFTEAARAVYAVDPPRALEMAVAAALMVTFGADSGARVDPAVLLAETSGDASPRARCLTHLLRSMTLAAVADWEGAVGAFAPAIEAGDLVEDLDVLANLGNAALQVGDDGAQHHFYALALSRARDAGAVMTVVYTLQRLCFGHLVAGDWAAVRSAAVESLSLSAGSGPRALTAPPLAFLTLLAALEGRQEYDGLLADLDAVAASHPLGILTDPVHDLTRWAKGARAAATGDPATAVHHLARIRLPVIARMAAVDRIDAAVRADEAELATSWVDQLDSFARGTARPWAAAGVALGRAMTADGADAAVLFEQALALHAGAGRPVDDARTHLAYGEWLRRSQRRVDARTHLRRALGTFQDLHAAPWEERAAQELRASGETARKRDPSTLVALTPMELKVAQLVSTGMSNKDVAAEIWVSPRTVAFHLRNVFAKANITSRGQLSQLDLS